VTAEELREKTHPFKQPARDHYEQEDFADYGLEQGSDNSY